MDFKSVIGYSTHKRSLGSPLGHKLVSTVSLIGVNFGLGREPLAKEELNFYT